MTDPSASDSNAPDGLPDGGDQSAGLPPALSDEMLAIYVSPRSRLPLRRAEASELHSLRARIDSSGATDRGGRAVERVPEAGLVCEQEGVLFPVFGRIPKLLWEDAIPLSP